MAAPHLAPRALSPLPARRLPPPQAAALDEAPFRPLHAANTLGSSEAAAAAKAAVGMPSKPPQQQQQAKGGGRSMTSLIYFFGVYFFFQWLVGRGS